MPPSTLCRLLFLCRPLFLVELRNLPPQQKLVALSFNLILARKKKPVLLYPHLKLAHSTRFSLVDYYVQQLSHQTLLSVRRNTIIYYKLFSETSKIKQNQTNRSKLFLVDPFLIGHFRIKLPLVGG